jgi:hypothetical protein
MTTGVTGANSWFVRLIKNFDYPGTGQHMLVETPGSLMLRVRLVLTAPS